MDFQSDYEKIDLSKQDFQYVFNNILQAIMAKLNLHLPAAQNDPLKEQVSTILEEFLINTFDNSKYSILADGLDLQNVSIHDILSLKTLENVEKIDSEITLKLRKIFQEFEQETVDVTKLRRDLPKQASEVYSDIIKQTDGEVSEIISMIEQQSQEYQKEQQVNNDDGFEKIIESMDFPQINQNYTDHLQLLNETNKNLPSLKIEFEKYNKTVQFLEDAYQQQLKEMEG
ncbi:kinetochore complex subunit, putative [Candida dubliniensis CD36]|uniref:Kinetochore complex subunit, putative n=1 Tax=Candida dubliniensis (strain CD36 / ATCC MYA-646 / CBS 7987 / NCPF 3949 / NRRL Y-17841) TaxID=573826 RepID=B9WK67_CANDC|nr:kinetochore complex subunit, putative [Candida dubliniensis CD36]CAX40719.1 kinetochore complex subunit, putative [Candida dubliniensis CD36]